jgi:hypothetical protein
MVIIEPFVAYLSTKHAHSDSEIRQKSAPLMRLADNYGVCIISIVHFRKGQDGSAPINQVAGSLAYGAMPRVVYAAVKDRTDPDLRLLVCLKNNLVSREDKATFSYRITDERLQGGIRAGKVVWEGKVDITADDAMAVDDERAKTKKEQIVGWIEARLAEGPVARETIMQEAKSIGYRWRTVEAAAEGIVIKEKVGFQGKSTWKLK